MPTTRFLVMLAAFATSTVSSLAAPAGEFPFETHADFFSVETKQPVRIDPQVFVPDPAAPAAAGPQGIKHAASFRPAKVETDPAGTVVSNADGKSLGFTLGTWLGATGQVTIARAPSGSGETVTARFHGLIPTAEYSLFENHFDQTPVGFTPLDGKGTANSFKSDAKGDGEVTVKLTDSMTHANAVLLVYHSDGQTHGEARGEIGVVAHHQLIYRMP